MYNDLKIIIVCENYDDYLAVTLPENIKAIAPKYREKEIVIVTDFDDKKTWGIAEKAGCVIVLSKRLHENGAPFAKGKAINDALKAVEPQDWVLLIDADIILPASFNKVIDLSKMNKDLLYFAKRKELRKKPETQPMGYFQLFNVKAFSLNEREKIYPEVSRCAGGDDDRFGIDVFPSEMRKQISGAFVLKHLSHGKFKGNWNGRKSPRIDVDKINNVHLVENAK